MKTNKLKGRESNLYYKRLSDDCGDCGRFLDLNDYSNIRIIQRKIVYVIGLSNSLADQRKLFKDEFFGQYGNVKKITINNSGYYKNNNENMTYSAYITYASEYEASLALLAIDNVMIDNNLLKASYGTTKYCNNYVLNKKCNNVNCIYKHSKAKKEDIIHINENTSKTFKNQFKMAAKIANIYSQSQKEKIINAGVMCFKSFKESSVKIHLPTVDTILNKTSIMKL